MTDPVSSQNLARRIARLPRIAAWCLTLAGILTPLGCGARSDLPELGDVKGVVTLDGKPLANAQIQFVPASGRPSSGTKSRRTAATDYTTRPMFAARSLALTP